MVTGLCSYWRDVLFQRPFYTFHELTGEVKLFEIVSLIVVQRHYQLDSVYKNAPKSLKPFMAEMSTLKYCLVFIFSSFLFHRKSRCALRTFQ